VTGCSGTAPSGEVPAAVGDKADSAWCHLTFDSVEGANVRVDYVFARQQTSQEILQTANPVWVNVSSPRFDGSEKVRVWIGDSGYVNKMGYDTSKEFHELQRYPDTQLDLSPSEDSTRATGQVSGALRVSEYWIGDDQAEEHAHEFAVVIDGEWQTDPISGSHNFLATALNSCN
jgi:hypothetical protein